MADSSVEAGGEREALGGVHALLSASEMQRVDARAVADGADGFALMRRAGEAVARHVSRLADVGDRVVIVAGPGNNGGDGAVAAHALEQAGFERVALVRAGGEAREGSDAARAFGAWQGRALLVPPEATSLPNDVRAALGGARVLVDALLGAGLAREVGGRFADLVRAMDAAGSRDGVHLVAVDLPSGLDGDAHVIRGVAARASSTVTFVRLKVAHCLYPGRALCGEILLEDIGMPERALAAVLEAAPAPCHANDPALWRHALPRPETTTHKFRRGHVLVRGGPLHQTGAARLSAGAALHAGAGLVTLATSREALAVNAAHLTAVMLRPCDTDEDWRALLLDERIGAIVVGPGNGVDAATAGAVESALAVAPRGAEARAVANGAEARPAVTDRACVLDADALTCHGEERVRFVERLRAYGGPLVLTPHEGEFARLFGADIPDGPSRLHRARAAAALAGAVVVLKGADTVVAAPDGRATINLNAPPWLATAGAGDVLAGVVGALVAQGMSAFAAASAAVWLHAEAARELGWPLTAEQLVPAVGRVLGRLASPAPPPLPRLALPDQNP